MAACYAMVNNYRLDAHSIARIIGYDQTDNWLDDEVINLLGQAWENALPKHRKYVYTFHCKKFNLLTPQGRNMEHVRRNEMRQALNTIIFKQKESQRSFNFPITICFAVNLGENHWILVIAENFYGRGESLSDGQAYDPFGVSQDDLVKILQEDLCEAFPSESGWKRSVLQGSEGLERTIRQEDMSSCGVFVCGWLKANLPPEKLRSNFTAYDEEVETRKLFNECVERAILLEFILSTCGTAHASALLPELQQALRTDSENRVLATERWRRSVRAHMAATRALRAAILGKRSALHSDWLAHMEDNNVMLDTELSSLEAWRNGMRDALRRGFGLDD